MSKAGDNKGSSSFATVVSVPRSLAERTEAMFRSVDPDGAIAQEWKRALATPSENAESAAMQDVWSSVRLKAEGADWDRDHETLAEWVWRKL
jgi:hypothetical protein